LHCFVDHFVCSVRERPMSACNTFSCQRLYARVDGVIAARFVS
jgi:hypothetical protein